MPLGHDGGLYKSTHTHYTAIYTSLQMNLNDIIEAAEEQDTQVTSKFCDDKLPTEEIRESLRVTGADNLKGMTEEHRERHKNETMISISYATVT